MANGSLGEAVLDLRADDSQLDSGLKSAEGKTKGWLGGMGDVLKTGLGTALGFGITDLAHNATGAIVDAFAGAAESAKVQAQTNAVLKSTGGIAGVTAEQIKDLASSLQETTLFTDEQTQSGQNMLLTFTNIGKDVFPETTRTMLDMSQALGQDVKTSAIQLGKALNDPIAGVSALSRVGVSFTEQQKEQIKTLVESGDVMGAQKVILAELNKEFGGSAKAAADTAPFQVFQNLVGDLTENLAGELLPVVNDLGKQLLAWLTNPETKAGIQGIIEGVRGMFATIGALVGFITGTVVPALQPLFATLARFWTEVEPKLTPTLQKIQQIVEIVFGAISAFITAHMTDIQNIFEGAWKIISGIFEVAWAVISGIVNIALDLLNGDFDAAGQHLQEMAQGIWTGIQHIIEGAWQEIQGYVGLALGDLWNAINGKMQEIRTNIETTWNGIVAWLGGLPAQMWQMGWNIVQGIIDGINAQASAVLAALQGIIDGAIANVKAALGIQSPRVLMSDEVGAQMAAGVRLGFERGLGDLSAAVNLYGRGGLAFEGSGTRGGIRVQPTIRITIGNREIRQFIVETSDEEIARVLSK